MASTGAPLNIVYLENQEVSPEVKFRDLADAVNDNAVVFVGDWSGVTTYAIGHLVIYDNGLYRANAPNTNKTPDTATEWDLWLEGVIGVDGAPGPQGDPGSDGTNFIVDAIDVIANRGTYDAEAAGFTFLASDESKVYMRVGVSGWSDGVPFGAITDNRIIVAGGFTGTPAASAVVAQFVAAFNITLPASLTGSQYSNVTDPTATAAFDIQKNGTSIGTMSISTAGVATFTFTVDVSFAAGDLLTVIAPATADATLADGAFSLLGVIV